LTRSGSDIILPINKTETGAGMVVKSPEYDKLTCCICYAECPPGNILNGYSLCCGGVVLLNSELNNAMIGKIPKVVVVGPVGVKKQGGVRDAVSRLRVGTTKYKAFQLWRSGLSCEQTVSKLNANKSSIRSWFSSFNHRFGSCYEGKDNKV